MKVIKSSSFFYLNKKNQSLKNVAFVAYFKFSITK